jgi:pantoate--beta-alanine ligase
VLTITQDPLPTQGPGGPGGILVPTMGALHEGHERLIRRGVGIARDRGLVQGCTVSIFVNPTQFNQPSDYQRYPRTLDADLSLCRRAGAAAVFAPTESRMYPPGEVVPIPPLPEVATMPGLEDAFRQGHFAGVCQVVRRLFDLVRPAAAIFGEKDWQQLRVVAEMAHGEGLGVEIVPHPTVRDPDGLALSSRNRFLAGPERAAALAIPRALEAARKETNIAKAEGVMGSILAAAGLRVEYAVVRDARTLREPVPGRPGRALIGAWSGSTRLIDNAPWPVLATGAGVR